MQYAIETREACPILGIRAQTKKAEVGQTVDRLMPQLMAVAGGSIAGPIVARYHSWEGDGGLMELAAPVRPGVGGSGEVQAGELPGGRVAVAEYVGSYEGLADAWQAFMAWLESEGLEGCAAPWEEYVSDCETTPPEKLVTRLVLPLAS